MLSIRLQRVGRKHEPVFRVVLTDSKNGPKSGKFLEVLGSYDSRLETKENTVKADRIKYWMSKGAKLSDTMHNFLVGKKVIEGKKVNVLPRKSPIKKDAEEAKTTETKVEAKAEAKVEPKAEEPAAPAPAAAAATPSAQ